MPVVVFSEYEPCEELISNVKGSSLTVTVITNKNE